MALGRGLTSHLYTAALVSLLLAAQDTLGINQEQAICTNHQQLITCTVCASLPGIAVTQAQCCDSDELLDECLSCLLHSNQCHGLLDASNKSLREKQVRSWLVNSESTSSENEIMPAYAKRPKYFLGKRTRANVDKRRNRNTFLGKRDVFEYSAMEKRRPFLGKRQAKPFLGRR